MGTLGLTTPLSLPWADLWFTSNQQYIWHDSIGSSSYRNNNLELWALGLRRLLWPWHWHNVNNSMTFYWVVMFKFCPFSNFRYQVWTPHTKRQWLKCRWLNSYWLKYLGVWVLGLGSMLFWVGDLGDGILALRFVQNRNFLITRLYLDQCINLLQKEANYVFV